MAEENGGCPHGQTKNDERAHHEKYISHTSCFLQDDRLSPYVSASARRAREVGDPLPMMTHDMTAGLADLGVDNGITSWLFRCPFWPFTIFPLSLRPHTHQPTRPPRLLSFFTFSFKISLSFLLTDTLLHCMFGSLACIRSYNKCRTNFCTLAREICYQGIRKCPRLWSHFISFCSSSRTRGRLRVCSGHRYFPLLYESVHYTKKKRHRWYRVESICSP